MADHGRLIKSSALVSVATLLSRVTGLAKIAALVGVLELSDLADVYNLANNFPNIIYELLVGGVLAATVLPLFVELIEDRDEEAVSAVVTVALVALAGVTAVAVLAAPLLAMVFTSDAAERGPLTTLLRWFFPQIFFYGVLALGGALLNARRRYGLASFAPALNNLVVVVMLIALPRLVSASLKGEDSLAAVAREPRILTILGLGTTAGVLLSASMLAPAFVDRSLRLRARLDWHHPAVRRVVMLSSWTFGHAAANQVTNLVVLRVAKGISTGALSAYTYAYLLWVVPHGLVAAALLTTLTPELSSLVKAGNNTAVRRTWTGGLRLTALAMMPAAAGLAVAAYSLVRVVPFWTAGERDRIAQVIVYFAPGLAAYSIFVYSLRIFYVHGDTRTPFRLNVIQNGIHVVGAVPLALWLGAPGLGLLSTVAYAVGAVMGFAAAARKLGRVPVREVRPLVGMAGAALAMALVVAALLALLGLGDRTVSPILSLAVCLVCGPPLYLAYLWAFRADGDVQTLVRRVRLR